MTDSHRAERWWRGRRVRAHPFVLDPLNSPPGSRHCANKNKCAGQSRDRAPGEGFRQQHKKRPATRTWGVDVTFDQVACGEGRGLSEHAPARPTTMESTSAPAVCRVIPGPAPLAVASVGSGGVARRDLSRPARRSTAAPSSMGGSISHSDRRLSTHSTGSRRIWADAPSGLQRVALGCAGVC